MCSYFGDGWCSPHFKAATADELLEKERRAKALQKNPDIMVDGAFNHRAVHSIIAQGGDPGQVYGTKITTTTLGLAANGATSNATMTAAPSSTKPLRSKAVRQRWAEAAPC